MPKRTNDPSLGADQLFYVECPNAANAVTLTNLRQARFGGDLERDDLRINGAPIEGFVDEEIS